MAHNQPLTESEWADFSARLRRYVGRRVAPSYADDLTGDILVRLVANADKLRRTDDVESARGQFLNDAVASLSRCMIPFINRLPQRYAEALLLTEIEGLTQRAAAQRLGLSVSGLKSRVQRGRRLLKQSVLRCCSVEASQSGRIVDYRRRSGAGTNGRKQASAPSGSAKNEPETTEHKSPPDGVGRQRPLVERACMR